MGNSQSYSLNAWAHMVTLDDIKVAVKGIDAWKEELGATGKTTLVLEGPLLERLGGPDVVKRTVADFYRRVYADEQLAPVMEGKDIVRMRAKMSAYMIWLLGGEPEPHPGRSLRTAHLRLIRQRGLAREHFDAAMVHLEAALRQTGVLQPLVAEVCGNVRPLREVIFTPSPKRDEEEEMRWARQAAAAAAVAARQAAAAAAAPTLQLGGSASRTQLLSLPQPHQALQQEVSSSTVHSDAVIAAGPVVKETGLQLAGMGLGATSGVDVLPDVEAGVEAARAAAGGPFSNVAVAARSVSASGILLGLPPGPSSGPSSFTSASAASVTSTLPLPRPPIGPTASATGSPAHSTASHSRLPPLPAYPPPPTSARGSPTPSAMPRGPHPSFSATGMAPVSSPHSSTNPIAPSSLMGPPPLPQRLLALTPPPPLAPSPPTAGGTLRPPPPIGAAPLAMRSSASSLAPGVSPSYASVRGGSTFTGSPGPSGTSSAGGYRSYSQPASPAELR